MTKFLKLGVAVLVLDVLINALEDRGKSLNVNLPVGSILGLVCNIHKLMAYLVEKMKKLLHTYLQYFKMPNP